MRTNKDWRIASLMVSLVLLFQLMVGAVYGLIVHPAQLFLERDSEQIARVWAEKLKHKLTQAGNASAGSQGAVTDKTFLGDSKKISGVFGFRLFDANANVTLASDEVAAMSTKKDSSATNVIKSGVARTKLQQGTPPQRPTLYAESYIPLHVGGKVAGVAKIYVDQAARREHFISALLYAAMGVALIVVLAFSVPALAFFVRSRQKRLADEKISFLARHDAMTGLMNRNTFLDVLYDRLETIGESDEGLAVHYIDIDRFKAINDTFGHHAGDKVIVEVADRLKKVTRKEDLLGRIGGDEFVVAQMNVTDMKEVENFAERMLIEMNEPFKTGHHDLSGTISIGIATAPTDSEQADILLKRADLALYRAKADGRDGFKRFEPHMDVELEARRRLENVIRNAAVEETFELHFQPLFHAGKKHLIGFEALLRLPSDEGPSISPAVFVPVAEEMGLISKIGNWVVHRACSVAAGWPEHIKIAINLSPLQFKDGEIVNIVKSALEKSGLSARRLELEITEGLLLTNTENVMEQLQELKSVGVSIVMDDFGTGYSSLSYLWQFPFDKIKIDRSFMTALDRADDNVGDILKTIITLGHSLKMTVTAEGVETVDQADFVKALSCDHVQGYLFGRPMSEQSIASEIMNDFRSTLPADEQQSADEADENAEIQHVYDRVKQSG